MAPKGRREFPKLWSGAWALIELYVGMGAPEPHPDAINVK